MRLFGCDMCGGKVEEGKLVPLAAMYQVGDMKEVCKSCMKQIMDQNVKITASLLKPKQSILRLFIANLKKWMSKTGKK